MILIINICKEKLHYLEFVKPIVDIVKDKNDFIIINITALNDTIIKNADKIIITGTSLQDFNYNKYIKKFDFLKTYKKPVLGICGGMQILCQVFDCKLIEGQEIGLINTIFEKEFLGLNGDKDIYTLHNIAVKEDTTLKKNFEIYSKTKYVQAIKHKTKSFYATLFHPEVRNKQIIINFLFTGG